MKEVNAFHPDYIKQELAKEGKKPKQQDAYRKQVAMVKFVENQRAKNPKFGTMQHMTTREDLLAPKQFNIYSRAGTK